MQSGEEASEDTTSPSFPEERSGPQLSAVLYLHDETALHAQEDGCCLKRRTTGLWWECKQHDCRGNLHGGTSGR